MLFEHLPARFYRLYQPSPAFLPALLFSLLMINGCKKTNSSDGSAMGTIVSSLPPAITPVGTPVGSPVTKTIGPAGGVLVSANGVLELKIPPGALSTNTDISIQPVMNEMPGALDTLSYDLLPNGTKFSTPATITFHYTLDQVNDNRAEFLFIAYQDSSRAWVPDIKQREYDTTAKTVSLDISHFTIFAIGDEFNIQATALVLRPFETSILTIHETYVEDNNGQPRIVQDDQVDGKYLSKWKVNGIEYGNSSIGTITPNASQASYLSPVQISQVSTVNVSVQINFPTVIYNKGKKVAEINGYAKSISIRLEPFHTYTLTVIFEIEDSTLSGYYDPSKIDKLLPVYTDMVLIHMKVQASFKNPTATILDFKNSPPTVSPASYKSLLEIWDWVPDSTGEINVTSVKSDEVGEFPSDSILRFYVLHKNAYYPGFKTTEITTNKVRYALPFLFSGLPDEFEIDFKANDHSNADNFLYHYDEGALGQWTHLTVFSF